MTDYEMKDSGERRQFDTGAQRDRAKGKGRYDLISPIALQRLAVVLEKGALKYEDRNWEKGMPMSVFLDSGLRHLFQYLEGSRDEDHLGQAMFNVMAAMHTEECINNQGTLPASLYDVPNEDLDDQAPAPHIGPHCVYVAGPYSNGGGILDPGHRDLNTKTAIEMGKLIADRGHHPHVPHAATGPFDGEWPYEKFMQLDFTIIRKWATALYRVEGESAGADREVELAESLGIPVWTHPNDIPQWLGSFSSDDKSVVIYCTHTP